MNEIFERVITGNKKPECITATIILLFLYCNYGEIILDAGFMYYFRDYVFDKTNK
jgi:hypothetical protein